MAATSSALEFVQRARRRRALKSLAESAALGTSAALVALAACRFSAGQAAPSALASCAAISGLAMAATWWVERAKQSELAQARQLDRRLERGGALAAVFEARRRGDDSAVARLLERRVVASLDASALRRALPAPGPIWLAPPAFAAALFALSSELPFRSVAGDASAPEAGAPPLAGTAPAPAGARRLLEQVRARMAPARADPRLREKLAAELAAALAGLPKPASETDTSTSELRAEIQDELAALAGRTASEPAVPGAAASSAGSPGERGAEVGGAEEGNSPLANGSPERTMSGSNRSTAAADSPRATTPGPLAAESGTLAGRWWDERYDPVVQGWRRALAARAEQR